MSITLKDFTGNNSKSILWKVNEDFEFFRNNTNLSAKDSVLLKSFNSPQRRTEFASIRYLVSLLNKNLIIEYTNTGKPIASDGNIGISHSENFSGIIWSKTNLCSIDIEQVSDRFLRIAHRAFSENENKFANEDIKLLTILWCCKECIYKIVNIPGISFKKQIKIYPFKNNQIIKCIFTNYDEIQTEYSLSYKEIEDHIIVWCIK